MARLVGLMAVTVWLSAATVDGRNGATAEITQLQDLRQNAGALLFEAGEGIGQKAPPIRTYLYVRIIDSKKETRQLLPCRSRTLPESRCCHSTNPASHQRGQESFRPRAHL